VSAALPIELENITPGWLAGVLSHRFPGVRPSALEVVDRHSGTTGRARLRVAYETDAGAPRALFAKLPPADPAQREMVRSVGMGRREASFYAGIADEAPLRLPRPYFAASDATGAAYVMLLEDLVAAGCRFPNPTDAKVLDLARDLVESLARLHARFWNSPRFRGDLAWVEPAMRHEIGPTLVARALERLAGEMPPVFGSFGRIYVEHSEGVCDLWDEGEQTLVHGDCHMGNLFLDGERVGFLDWACISRSPGIRDVSYFLCNSLPTELRRAEERHLLRRYLDTLAESGAPAPDFETAWHRHRRHAGYSWVAAATTVAMGDRWQSLRVGRDAIARTTAALGDLGTAELLREELGLPEIPTRRA
jgi:hypothetical protein